MKFQTTFMGATRLARLNNTLPVRAYEAGRPYAAAIWYYDGKAKA